MNEYELNLLKHIKEVGCSVTSVFDPEKDEPSFSYSIGIPKSCGAPELIVLGLTTDLGHALVNVYNDRVRAGERFSPGSSYEGFLKGFPIQFVPVAREHRESYMLSACWLHGGPDFEALQLIWPSTDGILPWAPNASAWLQANQPVLS